MNIGISFENFIEFNLKGENAEECLSQYQTIKESFEEILKFTENILTNNKDWRMQVKYLTELNKLVDMIPLTLYEELFNRTTEILLNLMRRGSELLKVEASNLLARLLFNNPI